MAKSAVIYVLSNQSLKGVLRIGHTAGTTESVLSEVNNSADIPTPYKLEALFRVAGPKSAAQNAFHALNRYRISGEKDFFAVGLEETLGIIRKNCRRLGYIYILSNPSFQKGIFKIGYTTRNVKQRVTELNDPTSVPTPFKIEAYFEVVDPEITERKIHNALREFRPSAKEFFKLDLGEAVRTISRICKTKPMGSENVRVSSSEGESIGIKRRIREHYQKFNSKNKEELIRAQSGVNNTDRQIEQNPERISAFILRAIFHHDLSNYNNCISDCEKAMEKTKDDKWALHHAHFWCGRAYNGLGDYQKAFEHYNKAIELGLNYPGPYQSRALLYSILGDQEKSVRDYKRAIGYYSKEIEATPNNARAYVGRGLIYYLLGEYETAISNYCNALEINPKYREAYVHRANAYNAVGNHQSSVRDRNIHIRLEAEQAERKNRTLKMNNYNKNVLSDIQRNKIPSNRSHSKS